MVSFSIPWISSKSKGAPEKIVTAESSSAEIAAAATGVARSRTTTATTNDNSTNDSSSHTGTPPEPASNVVASIARKDAETPVEREQRIRALFDRMDTHRAGFLRPVDIEQGVASITGQSYGGFAASELIRVADSSKDGVVDYREFRAFIERKERALRKIFDEMDVSKDQALQPDELKESLGRAGITVSDADVGRFMRLLDTDGDGSIQFDEWRNFLVFLPREINLGNIYRHLRSMAQITSDGEVVIATDVVIKSGWAHLIAGAAAGAVSRTATAPLDRLKVYLQTHPPLPSSNGNPLANAMRQLYTSGGIRNFFRGNGLNVLKIAPESGIKFLSYDRCKRLFGAGRRNDDGSPVELGLLSKFMAGGTAGVISQGAIYPLETLKTRMMASAGVQQAGGGEVAAVGSNVMLRVATEMWRETGIRAYYRGILPSLVGVFPFAAIDLACFETLKAAYIKRGQAKLSSTAESFTPSVFGTLVCGMISGTTGAVAVYPLSLVRTRLQAQGTPGHPRTYTGAFDVVRTTLQREGVRGFYKGLVPTLVKVVPAVGISYTVYEKTKAYFD
ncbi:mitochondrial carrier domain-containing protein [Syncephalis pseudoplumigaleata]|uniref:Mitochondrial carrier domain-containing protein n=1 Tax=Syncephalis pseudoplumigaleata TaxID=1712513 RepID=A0A4P9YXC9_9FUNG|nr:mitochondrial carrier domain-containing protein [Syncephalis pseudoplumigaleata]|eukprot:RKP24773.1 mitochondrial carrier domain-containing protein [Syncephalis pseudoplumigaleata]